MTKPSLTLYNHSMNNNEPLSETSKTFKAAERFIHEDSDLVNFKRYSFVTSTLIITFIYFVFIVLFALVAGTIGVMVSFFLYRYSLISWFSNFAIWQKVTIFGISTFLTANFCLFESEAIVAKIIKTKAKTAKQNDLQSLLKIQPNNWQKIFYSILLFCIATIFGYFFVVNYISWIYTQFWS